MIINWHIFQDDGTKTGWSVVDNILIFDADSGLDIDALKIVANGVNKLKNKNNARL